MSSTKNRECDFTEYRAKEKKKKELLEGKAFALDQRLGYPKAVP